MHIIENGATSTYIYQRPYSFTNKV